jgi:hypothetical protein
MIQFMVCEHRPAYQGSVLIGSHAIRRAPVMGGRFGARSNRPRCASPSSATRRSVAGLQTAINRSQTVRLDRLDRLDRLQPRQTD